MKKTPVIKWMTLALATVSVSVLPSTVSAQYQVGNDGRALDANNRIGSGGENQNGKSRQPGVTGNQIVTGNVTAGREFRGPAPYRDTGAFSGPTAGAENPNNVQRNTVDRFVAGSSGTPQPYTASKNLNTPQPFYGQSRMAPPPAGYVQQGYTGGYVPAPPTPSNYQDGRVNMPYTSSINALPAPGELMMPGPIDPSQRQTYISASPLYGVREIQSDPFDAASIGQRSRLRPDGGFDRLNIDQSNIKRMQEELQKTGSSAKPGDENPLDLSRIKESPANKPLESGLAPTAIATPALGANVNTAQELRQQVVLPPPSIQSAQYAELMHRLNQFKKSANQKLTPEEANRQYREQLRYLEDLKASQPKKIDGTIPKPTDEKTAVTKSRAEELGITDYAKIAQEKANAPLPREGEAKIPTYVPSPTEVTPSTPVKQLQVHSLAEGVQAKGLAELLTKAEELMKQGKFTSALDQYDIAERVAPNNKLIVLGRANAELGAGYYARAEEDLTDAFLDSEALLMGQYDLKQWLGEERLAFLVKDLKEITKNDTKQSRSLILLSYIAYNTGNPQLVNGYLEMAEKRQASPNPLIPMLKKHWQVEPEMNK